MLDIVTVHPSLPIYGQVIRNDFFRIPDETTSGDLLSALLEQRIRTLSELSSMAESLRVKSDLLREARRITGAGGWEWDARNRRMRWTDELYRLHGLEPGTLEPGSEERMDRSLRRYEPEGRPMMMEAFERRAWQGVPYDFELPFTDFMGERKWVRTAARAIRENGKAARVVRDLLDITEQKEKELGLGLGLEEIGERTRKKLDAVLDFEGDISELTLGEIMDPGRS